MPDSRETVPPSVIVSPVGSDEPVWYQRGASPPITPKESHGWPSLVTKAGMMVRKGRLCGA